MVIQNHLGSRSDRLEANEVMADGVGFTTQKSGLAHTHMWN